MCEYMKNNTGHNMGGGGQHYLICLNAKTN